MDGLIRQMSDLAAPGSRMCFDALHRDHMDGRVRCRGYSCGAQASLINKPLACLLTQSKAVWRTKQETQAKVLCREMQHQVSSPALPFRTCLTPAHCGIGTEESGLAHAGNSVSGFDCKIRHESQTHQVQATGGPERRTPQSSRACGVHKHSVRHRLGDARMGNVALTSALLQHRR